MKHRDGRSKKVLIIGATSAIAQAAARHFAQEGAALSIVARAQDRLAQVKADLIARGATEVREYCGDLVDSRSIETLFREIEEGGEITHALIAYGSLSNQEQCEGECGMLRHELELNFVSIADWVTRLAQYFERRRGGVLAVLGSVAGDRGRKRNYVYGAAKAGVSAFLGGVRHRLAGSGVRVVTIKPGMVDTPMTASMPKGLLFSAVETAGAGVYRAICYGNGEIYVPWYWRYIMYIVRAIPERLFARMDI